MSLEEEKAFMDEINDSFIYFLPVAPFVEIGDTTGGKFIKLKTSINIDEGTYSILEIIFELQYLLYIQKRKYSEITKLIVSDLQLTMDLPNTTFRRGLIIKMKYQ